MYRKNECTFETRLHGNLNGDESFRMQPLAALCSSLVSILCEEEEEEGRGGSRVEPTSFLGILKIVRPNWIVLLSCWGSFCFITRPLVVLFLSSRSVRGFDFF